jgi:hypothetical protein
MPVFFNDSADDPMGIETVPNVSGVKSRPRPNLLNADEAAEMLNADVSQDGVVLTRRGGVIVGSGTPSSTASRIQGLCWYGRPGRNYIVAAHAGNIYRWDGSSWLQWSNYLAASAASNVELVQAVDYLCISDGVYPLHLWDGATLRNLGTGASNRPPIGKFVIWHTNRLFMAGITDIPDALYCSDILDPATWDSNEQMLQIGGGDGEDITGLASWDDFNLVVFKRSSVWLVRTDPTATVANWQVQRLSNKVGCIAHRSIVQSGGDVWFMSAEGVRTVGRTIATTQREISDPISVPIQDVIDRINPAAIGNICASFWNNRIMFGVALDNSDTNNAVLVYNTLQQKWSGTWSGWLPTCFSRTGADTQQLVWGRSDGAVWRWQDTGFDTDGAFTDNGAAIPTRIKTRALFFQELLSEKQGNFVEVEFYDSLASATLAGVVDGKTPISINGGASFITSASQLLLPVLLPCTLPLGGVRRVAFDLMQHPPFRELQFVLESSGGKLALRTMIATAFVNTLQMERS